MSEVRERKAKFLTALEKFQKVQTDGSPDEARESLITDLRPAQSALQEGLKKLVDMQFDNGKALATAGNDRAKSSVMLTVIAMAAAVALGIFAFIGDWFFYNPQLPWLQLLASGGVAFIGAFYL